jgi:hypothetical protein
VVKLNLNIVNNARRHVVHGIVSSRAFSGSLYVITFDALPTVTCSRTVNLLSTATTIMYCNYAV